MGIKNINFSISVASGLNVLITVSYFLMGVMASEADAQKLKRYEKN